jgi:type I restriction enzyme S subunit
VTGRSGQLGKVFFTEEDYWPLNTTLYVQDFKGNNPKFIYYLLQTLNFESFNAGSSVPTLNRNHVHLMDVNVPDYETQRIIGNTLYTIEEKIKVNRSIIESLEELSQILFKRWFIDYEFPDEEGLPYKSSGGKMVESELGEIPEGWKIGEVKDLATKIFAGATPSRKKESYWENASIPWLKTKEIKNCYIVKAEEFISEDGLKNSSAKWIPEHSVVVAMYGATAGQLGYLVTKMTSNQACCAIVTEMPNYIYAYLSANQEQLKDLATGSAQQNLSKDVISKFKIICPIKDVLLQFEKVISTFSNQIIELTYENESLKELRDSLLPKLLSGQIIIPDESEVE